jgi:hypothetical protein
LDIQQWRDRYNEFKETSAGKSSIKVLRYIFLFALVGYIIYQLKLIGIGNVIENLPINPLFYILFAFIYLSLPLWEILIYKQFWKFKYRDGLRPFITKKILNAEVVGYSGEVYLYSWAKKKFGLKRANIFGPIKDNAILSSVVSNVTILIVLLIYTQSTNIDILQALNLSSKTMGGVVAVLLLIVLVLILFRKNLFWIKSSTLWKVVCIHDVRILCTSSLELLHWSIVMRIIQVDFWFTFLAVNIITSRLPFLPSQDLIFAGLGIELSRMLNVSSAGIAGLLLTNSALLKVTNLALYSFFHLKEEGKQSEKIED